MSYILDALRRADSERERGAVPSLHSKQIAAGVADPDDGDDAPGRSALPLWWAVGALSVALIGMAAWLMLGRSAQQPVPVPAVEPVAAAPVVPPPAPAVVQAPPVEPKEVPAAAVPPAPTRVTAAPKPAAKPVERPVAAAVSPRDEDAPVPSISELPDDIRRQLPALSVSGASYSKNPASRMLILNGQVFKEGDKVAPDLVLEQIRLKSAVLSFRGRRYSVSF
jgi:general secretion pathway protein B